MPGVNNLRSYGRWAFAEFAEVYAIQTDFEEMVRAEFDRVIDTRLHAREVPREPAMNDAPPVSEHEAT